MNPIQTPEIGEPIPAAHRSADTVRLMCLRRSTSPDLMTAPGPDPVALRTILTIAARVPDHRRVYPFRFVIIEGEGRARLGDHLAKAFARKETDAPAERIELERRRFLRAPVVVCIVSRVDRSHKTPEWEQVLTAGAVCQNALIAAIAHGYAATWITEWYSYDPDIAAVLGLDGTERIAGFVYIGTARENPKERPRPDLDSLIKRF